MNATVQIPGPPAAIDRSHAVADAQRACEPISLFISVCSGRGWHAGFGSSLSVLSLHLGVCLGENWLAQRASGAMQEGFDSFNAEDFPRRAMPRLEKVVLEVASQANIVVDRNRHLLEAQKLGCTHFLSLDDDMKFPPIFLQRMIDHQKPVVTVNYRKKTDEAVKCVCTTLDGREPISSEGKTGLERVGGMGMGLTLIDLRGSFKRLTPPYFAVVWNPHKQEYVIEDGVFSGLLREHNVEIWCDHDLTYEVGHIGDKEYRLPPRQVAAKADAA